MKNAFTIDGNTVQIGLSRREADSRGPATLEAVIDLADLERVQEYPGTWHAHWAPHTCSFYVHGNLLLPGGKQRTISLHRWLFNLEPGDKMQVDHRDHQTLNNRRANLRVVSHRENQQNQKRKPQCLSKYPGVTWFARTSKWRARITIDGKERSLGYYDDEQEAAIRYQAMAGLAALYAEAGVPCEL